ncbi:MAG: division/cell wall cluster transcriptional repressor MraZ [Cyclobacteriaceae bacterium]|nr:division/cell wall cluster transcriptional repressor MraZ [Cyclobacteriaceae bacterium]MCH8516259.1 division/cell wall cluster transcriptional repressor MraZ [Cyclobacteriaceae bacterium]
MAFITGEYDCKLDAKGRLALPAKVKHAFPVGDTSEMILRRSFEPCLELYPMVEFKKLYAKVAGLNEFNKEYRKFQRNFFRNNVHVELDSAGRLLIPKSLLEHGNFSKDVILVGVGNRVEIWDPLKYEEYLIQDQDEFSDMAQKILDD